MQSVDARHLTFDPFELAETGADPYAIYRELREVAPAYRNAARGFWALSRFEDVRAASRDWSVFSNAGGVDLDELGRRVFGPGDFLDMDPPEHDDLRAIVKTRFTPKSVATLEPTIAAEVDLLLDRIEESERFDGVTDLAWPLPVQVMTSLLGCSPAERAELSGLYRQVIERPPGAAEIPADALEAARNMRACLLAMARDRRRQPRGDVMTEIALGEIDDERLTDRELVGMTFVLFSAGIDTVASLIGNALMLLAQHPDQRRLVATDRSILPAAVEEALRCESPLQFNARTTTRPVEVSETTIPPDQKVLLLYGSANRDEARFEVPDQFDVTRQAKRHMAFGEGVHFCIGAPLARLQARLVLSRLLARVPDWEIAGEMSRLPAYNMRSLATLPLALAR